MHANACYPQLSCGHLTQEAQVSLALRCLLPSSRMLAPCVQVKPVWGDVHVVIAGLTNTYSSYVTTIEEYSIQRYEGASTIFGPHTLDAYIQVSASNLS